jgi:hypothetical protein
MLLSESSKLEEGEKNVKINSDLTRDAEKVTSKRGKRPKQTKHAHSRTCASLQMPGILAFFRRRKRTEHARCVLAHIRRCVRQRNRHRQRNYRVAN